MDYQLGDIIRLLKEQSEKYGIERGFLNRLKDLIKRDREETDYYYCTSAEEIFETARIERMLEIPHLEFRKRMGQGLFSKVYLAFDTRHDQYVAVKVLEEQEPDDRRKNFLAKMGCKTMRDVWDKEMSVLGKLRDKKHPNIVNVHEDGEKGGYYYIVLEYFERTLADIMSEESAFSPHIFTHYSREIASALAYVHSMNLVHGDIKPENIGIRKDIGNGVIRLADFGFSSLVSGEITNDSRYHDAGLFTTAPELFDRGVRIMPYCDVWSVGSIMYRMLFGEYPFIPKCEKPGTEWRKLSPDERNKVRDKAILALRSEEEFRRVHARIDHEAGEFSYIIRRCLDFYPENRYPDGSGLLEDVEKLTNTGNISTIPY
ncbi:MAG: serine/threonine protein kinase [Candidatus Aenigmarchaeota archaeon]|nr:serine/threonine protein kinase [Candidatus Aenigmarchaeota archaeon]